MARIDDRSPVPKRIQGVGTLIGLTVLLTLGDARHFRKSRDVGCYLKQRTGRSWDGRSMGA